MNGNFTVRMNSNVSMPASINFTISFENLSNETQLQETQDKPKPDGNIYEQIAWYIQIIHRPIVIVLGTIGNLLSFYIMKKGSLKEVSTCFYMAILALADTSMSTFHSFFKLNSKKFDIIFETFFFNRADTNKKFKPINFIRRW